jgi:microtubule-associated protein, RP/EB family
MDKGESFGILSDAYSVSKNVILDWMNEDFQLQLSKIEQCATAAVYCMIIDKIYPGTFNIKKVKWNAKFDYEWMENYKVLQTAFKKNGIKKNVDVDKLIKAKYQDNLEFCQWLKKYHDLHWNGEPYDPIARRGAGPEGQLYYIAGGNKVNPMTKAGTSQPAAAPRAAAPKAARPSTATTRTGPSSMSNVGGMAKKAGPSNAGPSNAELLALQQQATVLEENNKTLETEREFYFNKLQYLEEIITKNGLDKHDFGAALLDVMYAAEGDTIMIDAQGSVEIVTADGARKKLAISSPDA